jgi:hypothetical protein
VRKLDRLARRDDDHAADMEIQRLTLLPADVNRREASGEQPVPQLRESETANREMDGADAAAADDEAVRLGPPREQVEGVAVDLKVPVALAQWSRRDLLPSPRVLVTRLSRERQ